VGHHHRVPGRFDLTHDALAGLLPGEPAYRARQLWTGLHQGREPAEMTELPGALRERLSADLPPGLRMLRQSESDGGDTVKWLWGLPDGAAVETVLMRYPHRATVCISSQAGCAMACSFCATGQAGFTRHLTAGEIVEQVVRAQRAAAAGRSAQVTNDTAPDGAGSVPERGDGAPSRRGGRAGSVPERRGWGPARVTNIVFMGMGEPLANYGPVWAAIERLHDELGFSARHITVSTVGVIPGILRLAAERLPVNLAVSLHAANDELRDQLVPLNRRYPLADLLEACRGYLAAKGRRLSFEWALIDGVNDRPVDADELALCARPLGAHVNLIPLNPTPRYPTRGTPPAGVRAFRDRLRAQGVNATVRRNRGTDIDAACGQLAARVG
jgi:23S rRNA (adenine2503-C2)-methyltransferase